MIKALIALCICLLIPVIAIAQNPPLDTTAIDAYIYQEMKTDRIPGLALAIVYQDQVVYTQGYGVSGIDKQAVTPDTSFLLGSMSKSFTALAIMQLVEEDMIDLNAPVRQYLPSFTIQGNVDDITIAHLLHHTSGIAEYAPRAKGSDQSLNAQIRALSTSTLTSQPGTVYEYSSPNYIVLGGVIEAVSQQSFPDYIQIHIFEPLQMDHSYTSFSVAQEQGGMSSGYQYLFGQPVIADFPEEPGRLPAASLISSASDLARYMTMQLNGGRYNNETLLSPDSIQQMHMPDAPRSIYGMGWRISEIHGALAVHHGGILPNFRGKMVMLPDTGWGVVVLTNVSSTLATDPSSHRMADAIAGMLVK